MIAWRTADAPTGLALQERWDLVAILVACGFVGQLLFSLLTDPRKPGAGGGISLSSLTKPVADGFAAIGPYFGGALILFAVVFPFMPWSDRYIMDLAILVLTYVMLAWGLNIVVGLAGLLDLGYVAFYAVGAYSYALLAAHFGFSFWICLPLAGILAAFWGILLGFPVLAPARRLSRDRDARVRRDHPHRLAQLVRVHGGPDGLSSNPAARLSSGSNSSGSRRKANKRSIPSSTWNSRRCTGSYFSII
jgi:branched-chain amino acid transport system permease protein